ncbi:putative phage abortive infection protein [Henriciella algicola]|uniref:Phage abortive infection protein n=1 Tax=Henriciella algicola TaxID=1608422 RepID=A0A399RAA8_9PROT|nr:putative phage abortive infection protein [Henriciella algicola]RIJ27391.1 hypothetical protein D1222_13395 [Henriciella algicola]
MMHQENSEEADIGPLPQVRLVIIAVVTILILWTLNLIIGLVPQFSAARGTFGDVFGVSNSLFSGLALAGVIYAILLQRSEIRLAKEELKRTKKIFEEQSASLSLQNRETKKQIFENTFFQILRVFTDLTSNLDLVGRNEIHGKDVFRTISNELSSKAMSNRQNNRSSEYGPVFNQVYLKHQDDLGHYFRVLYNIVKFVDRSEIDDKKFYTNIVRAQLSNAELHLLLYNGLSSNGAEKFKPLLETYAFFDNLPLRYIKFEDAVAQYSENAFGDNAEVIKLRNKIIK